MSTTLATQRRDFLNYTAGGALALVLQPLASASPIETMRRVDPSYFGLNMMWPIRAPYVQNFPSVPFAAWRCIVAETHWFSLEPRKGEWHFDKLDIAMRLMESRGIDVMLTLYGAPTWASSKPFLKGVYVQGESAPPRNIKDWEDYVRKVVERYRGRISTYELWNEPAVFEADGNRAHFTAAQLVEMARSAHKIIKEVDPKAKLTSPPMVGGEDGVRRMEAFLAAGGGAHIDIVSFHFYGVPHNVPSYHMALIKVLAKYGVGHLPIWNTEFGYLIEDAALPNTHPLIGGAFARVLTPHETAEWLGRSMITAASLGIERFYWFMWDNRNMALITIQDRKINAAGVAYGTVAKWLTGRLIGPVVRAGSMEYCSLANNAGPIGYLVWAQNYENRRWQIPHGWSVQSLQRIDGNTEKIPNDAVIDVSAGPTFLSFSS